MYLQQLQECPYSTVARGKCSGALQGCQIARIKRMTIEQQIERLTQGCVDVVRLDDLGAGWPSGARSS